VVCSGRSVLLLKLLSAVLEDIVKTMHNETFMAELFKPHRMYSNVSTRQIFDRLAHSSIMRLNANSMDKVPASAALSLAACPALIVCLL